MCSGTLEQTTATPMPKSKPQTAIPKRLTKTFRLRSLIQEINSTYFRSLSEALDKQLTGAAQRILRKTRVQLIELESRVTALESRVNELERVGSTKTTLHYPPEDERQ